MEQHKGLLLIHILSITILNTHADNFIQPNSIISDIASKSKGISVEQACSDVDCYKEFCAGRHSTPIPDKILNLSLSCNQLIDPPSSSITSNGYVHYTSSNLFDCNVTKSFTGQEYTLSFWVKYKCGSGSDCSINLSSSTKIEYDGINMRLNGRSFTLSAENWFFIVLKRNTESGTVFIGSTVQNQNVNLPSPVDLEISPSSINASDYFTLVDMRFYSAAVSEREIQQIFSNAQNIASIEPYTECRCPSLYPKNVYTDTSFSLECAKEDGTDVISRFNEFSIPYFMIDNDTSTSWKINQINLSITLEFTSSYQIHEIEVKLESTPCEVKLVLGSGHSRTFIPPYNLKWSGIGSNIQKRSQYELVLSNKLDIEFIEHCGTNEVHHQISEIIVKGRCHCYGNSDTCGAGNTNTCNCSRNTKGTHCQTCADKYYRQAEEFGCQRRCQCNEQGSSRTCNQVGGQCQCKTNVEGTLCDTCKHLHYNLSSSNSDGCTRSSCHENGTLRCKNNVTCDECICQPNVKNQNCDACKVNYYGVSSFDDGCKACDCNEHGTKDISKSCNVDSGQCSCKTLTNGEKTVTGRRCDTCVDGYYDLNAKYSAGCIACSCNVYGSKTSVCDKSSGRCSCFIGSHNRICEPVINSITPTYGPLAGGTRVTLRGHHLGEGSTNSNNFTIFLDNPNNRFQITTWTQEEVVFVTKLSSTLKTSKLSIKWATASEGKDKFENMDFEYKSNPTVTDVKPLNSYRSGGCDITISGNNLNSIYKPQMKSYLTNDVEQLSDCTASGSTLLVCKSPNVTDKETSFTYGLVLDGVTTYSNLSNQFSHAMVDVVNDPIVTRKEYDDYKMLFSDTITIMGSHLKAACTQNLKVTIRNVNCIIESATNESIVCKPDIEFPGINIEDADIMVEMGDYKQSAGLITFIEFWKTIEFIGIAIGAGCGVFLVFVIVICCCCKKRRKSTYIEKSSKQSKDAISLGYVTTKYREKSQNYQSLKSPKKPPTNGFDRPATANSIHRLTAVEKEDVPRFSNRLYSEKHHLETALSYDEKDCSEDFLHKIESTVRDKIQRSVSDRKHIEPDKLCTLKGSEIRVIKGKFSKDSPKAGTELTIKTNVRMLNELLKDNVYPAWLNNGLLECMKFQDCFHDNIIGILGISVDLNRFYIMYPYSTRVFKEYLKDSKNDFTSIQLLEMCAQVANGMSFIDKENMVHKDLAARNCVVMPDGHIKISDASFSWNLYPDEYMYDKDKQRYLPVRWMAKESLTMGFYDISSDVWSFGVLIWEVMTLASYLPYHDQESDKSIKSHIDKGFRLGKPTNISDDLYGLMVNCWEADNIQRPTFDELLTKLNSLMDPESLYVNQAFN